MKKKIIIEIDGDKMSMSTLGYVSSFELLGILRFFEKNIWLEMNRNNKPVKEYLHVDQMVEILPSEFCVTNTDTIKYDEIVSGKICIVKEILESENKVKVKLNEDEREIFVHKHWLKHFKM